MRRSTKASRARTTIRSTSRSPASRKRWIDCAKRWRIEFEDQALSEAATRCVSRKRVALCPQERLELLRRHRRRPVEALPLLAAEIAQQRQRRGVLDAFGDREQV